MPQSTENISGSVGVSGTNRPTDVAWIQAYLNVTLDPRADQRFGDLFELAFRLNLRESGQSAPSAKQLAFVRQKFERATTLLRQPIRPLLIKVTVTASESFILSGFAPAELAIRTSGNFSFFCQGMDAGGTVPRPFHHAPDGAGGWNDRPGLS